MDAVRSRRPIDVVVDRLRPSIDTKYKKRCRIERDAAHLAVYASRLQMVTARVLTRQQAIKAAGRHTHTHKVFTKLAHQLLDRDSCIVCMYVPCPKQALMVNARTQANKSHSSLGYHIPSYRTACCLHRQGQPISNGRRGEEEGLGQRGGQGR